MIVFSGFDGMSGGQLALNKIGVKPDKYFASEIDKPAISVTNHNFKDTIQLGDINNYKSWDLPKIDLAMAGSPCQDLSRIKSKDRKGLFGEKSKLFFKYAEFLNKHNPKYFLLENVIMEQEHNDIITSFLGVEPIEINSSHFSAQDRPRLYWTNIPFDRNLPTNDMVIKDIIENEVDEKYYYDDQFDKAKGFNEEKRQIGSLYRYYENGKVKFTETTSRVYNVNFKSPTLTAVQGGHQEKKIFHDGRVRKLTPLEYERLQTVPDNYTATQANSQRYKMLGNGWTIDAVAWILKGMK